MLVLEPGSIRTMLALLRRSETMVGPITYVGGDSCSRPGCDCSESDGRPFAYTVGLFGLGHSELLIFGVPPGTAAVVLNSLGERIRAGENLLPGLELTVG